MYVYVYMYHVYILLDLNTAFDTLDHHRLLHTMESSCGIQGHVLDWFQYDLTDLTSEPHEWKYGVTQGFVLDPILFTIYTTLLGKFIRRHGLTFHPYVDDTQLYLTFKPSEP